MDSTVRGRTSAAALFSTLHASYNVWLSPPLKPCPCCFSVIVVPRNKCWAGSCLCLFKAEDLYPRMSRGTVVCLPQVHVSPLPTNSWSAMGFSCPLPPAACLLLPSLWLLPPFPCAPCFPFPSGRLPLFPSPQRTTAGEALRPTTGKTSISLWLGGWFSGAGRDRQNWGVIPGGLTTVCHNRNFYVLCEFVIFVVTRLSRERVDVVFSVLWAGFIPRCPEHPFTEENTNFRHSVVYQSPADKMRCYFSRAASSSHLLSWRWCTTTWSWHMHGPPGSRPCTFHGQPQDQIN